MFKYKNYNNTKLTTTVINVNKKELNKRGIKNFDE